MNPLPAQRLGVFGNPTVSFAGGRHPWSDIHQTCTLPPLTKKQGIRLEVSVVIKFYGGRFYISLQEKSCAGDKR